MISEHTPQMTNINSYKRPLSSGSVGKLKKKELKR
jgi:hypothetical protein